nr:MAG TPA: hypothetical protein [Caudoviricetes sp.]
MTKIKKFLSLVSVVTQWIPDFFCFLVCHVTWFSLALLR